MKMKMKKKNAINFPSVDLFIIKPENWLTYVCTWVEMYEGMNDIGARLYVNMLRARGSGG